MAAVAKFRFSDLQSSKDYVVYVQTYLPDRFPQRRAVGPEDQWTPDLAFEGLRLGLNMAVEEKYERVEFAVSRRLVEEVRSGFTKLEQYEVPAKNSVAII